MKWLITLLADAQTALAIARSCGAAIVVTYIGMTVYAIVWKGQHFDMQSFGIGAGAVIAAMGAAERLSLRPAGDKSTGGAS